MCWNELATGDADAAGALYATLFGWIPEARDMGAFTYTLFKSGDKDVGGMLPMQGDKWQGTPPHWVIYFMVEDCDQSVSKVDGLGGKVVVPPTDIPTIGRFSLLQDPTGAMSSIISFPQGTST